MGGLTTNINAQIPRFLRLLGIDRAVAYTLLGRVWAVLAGPATLVIVAAFLTQEEQGFYYTFSSLLALQFVFELGLSYVLLQFASHEKAHLEWTAEGTLTGNNSAKGRLASLLRRGLVWYGVVSIVMVLLILPAGFWFFSNAAGSGVTWQIPWLWVVLVSAGMVLLSPLFAILEGCGLVKEVALVRTVQGILGNLFLWLALYQHWQLFAAPIPLTVGIAVSLGWLVFSKRALLADLWQVKYAAATINWRSEIWPLQWKVGLTWIAGYFVFQLFNPLLFALHGPVAAGQMGMSLSIAAALSATALSWVNTKAAPFGNLVAKRDYETLDRIFLSSLRQSFVVILGGGVTFWLAVVYLNYINHPFSERLLDPLPFGLLIATTIINHILFAEAIYLRAHKQEPFVWISLAMGVLIGLGCYVFGSLYGALGMMGAYFAVMLVLGLFLETWVFLRMRRQWHSEGI